MRAYQVLLLLLLVVVCVISLCAGLHTEAGDSVRGDLVRATPKKSRTLSPTTSSTKGAATTKATTTKASTPVKSSAVVPVSKLSGAAFSRRLRSRRAPGSEAKAKRRANNTQNMRIGMSKRIRRKKVDPSKYTHVFAAAAAKPSTTASSAAKKSTTAKKVRFASLRDPTGAGGNGGQSGKTGGQSGKTGGQSGKTGGQSGKTGGQSGKTGGQSGKTGGQSGKTGGKSGKSGGQSGKTGGKSGKSGGAVVPVGKSSDVPENGIDPKQIMVLTNVDNRGYENPLVVFFRNQGEGAGCWAIAAATVWEMYLQMKGASYVNQNINAPIAVDQIIKCVPNAGINGGNPMKALNWLFTHKTILEKDYRAGTPLTCEALPPAKIIRGAFGVWDNPCTKGDCSGQSKNEMAMAQNMFAASGYVNTFYFTYVDASQWQPYQKPDWSSDLADPANLQDYVFPTKKCSYNPEKGNHIVVIEAIVEDPKTQKLYWKILNSWGSNWGANGFIYLEFGVNACGLANYVMVINQNN